MTVEYLDLANYLAIAAAVTGLDVATLMKVTSLDLADSALHAPPAGSTTATSTQTSSTKQPCSSFGWHETIPCPMPTSGSRGWRYDYSSRSTARDMTPRPRSMMPRHLSWQ